MRGFVAAATLVLGLSVGAASAAPLAPAHVDDFTGKPRLAVLTDMGNEPDDQMSFVRLMVYSNEFDIEALVATTSTWQRTKVQPQTMREIIEAYGKVRPNLAQHARGWPAAAQLLRVLGAGHAGYGLAAVQGAPLSEGARLLIAAGDRNDPRPLWVSVWGGANTLAEALGHVRATRRPEALAAFVGKLRVYSISDQDDAGPWIRREFPDLFYVANPSTPNADDYRAAAWTGISGDVYYRNGAGADYSTVTNEWLEQNIRAKGPLGAHYPKYQFIMEGDTPAFLGLIGNGLNSYRNPSWGGWGGRYYYRQAYGETRPHWTQGGDMYSRATSQDVVTGADGREYSSDQATIWRWRTAYQHDFAARMDWTVKPFSGANHNPAVVVNGQPGAAPIVIPVKVGRAVTLSARGTRDPDGQTLRYRWFHYAEAGASSAPALAAVTLGAVDAADVVVTANAICRPQWLPSACGDKGVAHIILAVTDDGTPALTSYRRVILEVTP